MAYNVLGPGNKALGSVDSMDDEGSLHEFYDMVKSRVVIPNLSEEYLPILTESGDATDCIKLRDLVHRDGDWHRAVHLHVCRFIDDVPYILLQRRHPKKDIGSNKLDTAVAGHFAVGETLETALERESTEELGFSAEHWRALGLRKLMERPDESLPIYNNEYQDVLYCISDRPLEGYELRRTELSGLFQVPLLEFVRLQAMRIDFVQAEAVTLGTQGEWQRNVTGITRDYVRDSPDQFHLKSALLLYHQLKSGESRPMHASPFDLVTARFLETYPLP